MMRGKLNLFQAMMLRWRELHPYNAVHVVAVEQSLQAERLKARIASRLEAAGLTGFVLDAQRGRFEYRGGTATVDVAILAAGGDALHVAEQEIERQLNLPFPPDGAFLPFRFFAVDAGSSFRLGLVYDHFIAGGDSIAVLLQDLVESYRSAAPATASDWMPCLYPRTYARLFFQHAGYAIRGLRRLPALAESCRQSCRAPCAVDGDAGTAFLLRRVADPDCARLVRVAKDWGVTRGDLLLALLLHALGAVTPQRSLTQPRRELAVAAIVNVRGELEADATATFGQFLASLRVAHPVPPGIGLRELAQAVHAETGRAKIEKLYLQALLGMAWTALAWRFLTVQRRRGFLAKHYPIWVGVSSLGVDALWQSRRADAPAPEYLRAVPTGPLAPLVVAITTFGGVMQLGVSYRRIDVRPELADALASEFLGGIQRLG